MPTPKPLRIISLGWGVQSWTLAAMAALGELDPVDYAIHADTTHEAAGTYAHAAKWTPWLEAHGVKVLTVFADSTTVVENNAAKAVTIPAFTTDGNGSRGQIKRQCTQDWKIAPIRRALRGLIGRPRPGAVHSIQGISFDEWHRMRTSDVQYIENLYPLVDRRITRLGCINWLEAHELDVPPKSACTFCPYHSLSYWGMLKRGGGDDWGEAVAVDNAIRHKREIHGKSGMLLYVHPARLPLSEAVSIPEDIGARQLGLFEEEQPCDSGYCFT
jgi:hypothetical protein